MIIIIKLSKILLTYIIIYTYERKEYRYIHMREKSEIYYLKIGISTAFPFVFCFYLATDTCLFSELIVF